MKDNKTVAFVPLKLNNNRLPGKNTKCFSNGRPLCSYIFKTLADVKNCALVDEVYAYCSNDLIRKYLPEELIYLQRSCNLDGDHVKINDVLRSFAQDVQADIYVLCHATAPFISKDTIAKAVEAVREEHYDSALSVIKLQEFLWKDGAPFNYDPAGIPRTQDIDPIYEETCGLYVYRRELIEKQNRRVGFHPALIEVCKIESVDINTEEDFLLADAFTSII